MAIQKSITDEQGVTHSSAYSRIRAINLNYGGTSAEVIMVLDIFTNAAARSKGDTDEEKLPVLSSQVAITGNDFTTYFADSVFGLIWEVLTHRFEHLWRDGKWMD